MPASFHDPSLVLLSLLAVGALALLSRRVPAIGRTSPSSRRKALHAAVGAWTLIVTPLFHHLAWAILPPALFVVLNSSKSAALLMPGLANTRAEARGLWTFPLGIVLVYLLFWQDAGRQAILAGIVALAFADPIAATVGARYGQRRFLGFGHGRTVEGSAAFFVVAAVGAGIIAAGTDGGSFPWRMGLGCGFVGAAAESLTPSGWDNVTIPLAVATAYHFLA